MAEANEAYQSTPRLPGKTKPRTRRLRRGAIEHELAAREAAGRGGATQWDVAMPRQCLASMGLSGTTSHQSQPQSRTANLGIGSFRVDGRSPASSFYALMYSLGGLLLL